MLNIEKYKEDIINMSHANITCCVGSLNHVEDCTNRSCKECKKECIEWLLSEAQILDNAEKRYLKCVIRPFKNKVKSIAKLADMRYTEEYIYMFIEGSADAALPRFDEGTMYKGMELGRRYTLEELGL